MVATVAVLGVLPITMRLAQGEARHAELVGYGHVGSRLANASTGAATDAFRISGRVTGLFPGHASILILTIANTRPFPIIVTSVTTTAKGANASCGAANVTVSAFSGRLRVPALARARTSVSASLIAGAPDACSGAAFPLVFAGTAVKATP